MADFSNEESAAQRKTGIPALAAWRKIVKGFSLYQKFALTIILLGLLPMAVLATFIANKMIKDYSLALSGQ